MSKELFEKVQRRLAHNKECYRNSKITRLLSGLVWCGRCGSRCFGYRRLYSPKREAETGLREGAAYRCKTIGVHNTEIDTRVLDSCVLEMVAETMLDPEAMRRHMDAFRGRGRAAKSERKLREIGERIANVGRRKERVLDLYASGGIDRDECVGRTREHDDSIALLESSRRELLQGMRVFGESEAVEVALQGFCAEAKRRFDGRGDLISKRRFLLDRVAKVSYSSIGKDRVGVRLTGSVPVQLGDSSDDVAQAGFIIERTVRRAEQFKKALTVNI